MAALILTNCAIYSKWADLSGFSNRVALSSEVDVLDTTTFGSSGYRSSVGGLKKVNADIDGYFESLNSTYPDERLFTDLSTAAVPHTFSPTGGADGDLAYFFRSTRSMYSVGGSVGDLAKFTSSASGSSGEGLVRGSIAHPAATFRTSTGSGTALQVGAVSATQSLYAALHVLSASGTTPSLTVRVQSDTVGFSSATTQITFSATAAVTTEWQSVAGAITDDYWRADWTISGTNPSFRFVLAIGIA